MTPAIKPILPHILAKWEESRRNRIFMRRHLKACRDLQRRVDANANSFEITDYRKRREAALKARNRVPSSA